ncbi:hypothetical protein ACHQM5_025268 [Ranunculus cassubicifolius]
MSDTSPPPSPPPRDSEFNLNQRVHSLNDPRRIGTVKYIGSVQGYSGTWIGIDWDNNGDGKHNGSINGVQYFVAKSEKSASFVRSHNLCAGISFLQALEFRYRGGDSTKEEQDEMYVLSASNRRVSIQLLGKDKLQDKLSKFEELVGVSLSYLGVSSVGPPEQIRTVVPNIKELDLTGNLLTDWKDVGIICQQLENLAVLNLSNNRWAHDINQLPSLENIHVLVLNDCGISWTQVETLKQSLPVVRELHLMGNNIMTITPLSSDCVQGFDSLRVLNLEDNLFANWDDILKFSRLRSLEELHLNKNNLKCISYPKNTVKSGDLIIGSETQGSGFSPFEKLQCLLLGGNKIADLASVDSLNSFPNLKDVRLSDNPVVDPANGGISRFVLIARLAKVEILNGSEVTPRERKESEIRYVRFVMSKMGADKRDEIKHLHPRFAELKYLHGIEDEKPKTVTAGPQKMASGLVSITLKCVGPSIGEKLPLTKKLPATTTVVKLKFLCDNFFKLKSIKPKLFLQEEGSSSPLMLDDEMMSLIDLGIGSGATILVDEQA